MCAAKGRTNLELREQFFLAEGVSQSMSGFRSKMLPRQSSPGAAGSQVDSATTASGAYSSSAASASAAKVGCATFIPMSGQEKFDYDTIRYSIFTCAQKLMRWPA